LFFEFVQQTPIEDSGILLLGRNDYCVGFLDVRKVVFPVSRDDIVRNPFLKDFSEFLTLLGVRPQNEDGVRHSFRRP
jgi:hypothetical protein